VWDLSQYDLKMLRQDGEFILYRGVCGSKTEVSPSSILVLSPVMASPAPATLSKLEYEFALKSEFDPGWAIRPLALTQHHGRTMLLLEDPGGGLLDRAVKEPIGLKQFLHFAIGLAAALTQLHGHGLIHKDIKPSNVLLNSDTGQVWLMGFGMAARFRRERQSPEPPEFIAGTLAYMAPEQTGRMNRSIDSRSDLYALGVTLYEILTGSLPFTASDPMEWVHCHIARQPEPADGRRKDVPRCVSAIIMKLLAKTAEERYQTAAGLERDLRRCLADWDRHRRIDDFPLGENDTPDWLLIPEKLYGREREIETLLASFDRVVTTGAPELVLVCGYSGIGKSSVVNELHKALVPRRGFFASGKFDQYKRDVPYSTLAQAFQTLIRSLLGRSEADLAPWRDTLREALGRNGRLMIDLVPELKLIIGEQPPVSELSPRDDQMRFQFVFRRFIGVFTRPEHPLTLFLDDLQWLDAGTLDLLGNLLIQGDVRYLLVIGAYRDNEVDAAHPLKQKLEVIRKAGAIVHEITLAPLARRDLDQLVADTLQCDPRPAIPLAALVYDKTAGSPFFAIQFITALSEEGLLEFDHVQARWCWDLERIRAKGYTDNVADLIVGKLSHLPAETQKALQQMACLGNIVEIATLSIAFGIAKEQVDVALREAVRLELVDRLPGAYKFVHDRVQEAAYSLIPEASRADAHLRIGRLLVAQTPGADLEERIFDIVSQLNRGAALITSREEREQLAGLNLLAGKRAKASAAYASALKYLIAGALLPEDAWERQHELIFELELNRAECEFLTGALVAAEKRLSTLSSRAANVVNRAATTRLRIGLYTVLDRPDRAVEVCLQYLRDVGIAWAPHPTDEEVREEYERMCRQLGSRPIEALVDLPLMSDPACCATMEVLMQVVPPAYYTDANLWCLVLLRMANLSIEHGNSDASCFVYAILNLVLGSRFADYRAGSRLSDLSLNLLEKRHLKRFQTRVLSSYNPWARHSRADLALIRRGLAAGLQNGDLAYTASAYGLIVGHLFAVGDPLKDVQREAEYALKFVQNAHFGLYVDLMTANLRLIKTLRGLTPVFGSFSDDGFEEARFEQHLEGNPYNKTAACWYRIRKLQAHFYAGDYRQAISAATKAQQFFWITAGPLAEGDCRFYEALARACASDSATLDERRVHFDALAEHHKRLAEWAENCPENFENRAALVGAEIARIEGRELDAERLYERAIRSARTNGFVHNEALAYERASAFYRTRGLNEFADRYLSNARQGYLRWGADGKVRQLDRLYPDLKQEQPVPGPTSSIATPVELLDLAIVVEVSQAVSGEIVLEKLLDIVMRKSIEHAGAECGLLILPHGGEFHIRAEARTGDASVTVRLRDDLVSPAVVPESVLRYVVRTREHVILDDASAQTSSEAAYFRQKNVRSVLCLPLLKQGELIAVLYLENNLAARVFTPARLEILRVLASAAAISLENSRLYRELQEREAKIRRLVDANIVGVLISTFEGQILEANDAFLEVVGYDREDLTSGRLRWIDLTPAEWRSSGERALAQILATGICEVFEMECFGKDGSRVPVLVGAAAIGGTRKETVAFVLDLTERKQAEEAVRQSEKQLRDVIETMPAMAFTALPDGSTEFVNRRFVEYTGLTAKEAGLHRQKTFHPEDFEAHMSKWRASLATGERFENEVRLRSADGQYRWFLVRGVPLRDEQGKILKWFGTLTDIEDRKQTEERLRHENVFLREEVDKGSMFEEIVGTSTALQRVLARVAGVAPTDSTVLITGETGTGKELIARALHKQSQRSGRAFVSVNCAALAPSLISSELFGHEKGAFTGATQRRPGRFELSDGGTIFLDEVGELPPDTQVMLLRVLQEREFERVGGTQSIKVDVRVIAATNRDLTAAVSHGSFRPDLFYRLNVFPIEVPPLRERRDDILILLEYFTKRYASQTGKNIRSIDRKTLELFQSYDWPGNIRELQNVVERSVILTSGDVLSVDESWLSKEPSQSPARVQASHPSGGEQREEREIIEAALAESKGRVYGSAGAAAKLGIPPSTLDYKIKLLKIHKSQFKYR